MDIQRQEFEDWYLNHHHKEIGSFDGEYYKNGYQHTLWVGFQAAKAQAVPEKDVIINKLSDQLYEQEMKTSAARVLCETACELLDDYAHQDAMVILNDLEQAMSTGAKP